MVRRIKLKANREIFGFQIAVISTCFSGKLQHTVIRISDTFLVEDRIALSPDHVLGLLVCQYIHDPFQHNAFIPKYWRTLIDDILVENQNSFSPFLFRGISIALTFAKPS